MNNPLIGHKYIHNKLSHFIIEVIDYCTINVNGNWESGIIVNDQNNNLKSITIIYFKKNFNEIDDAIEV